MFRCLLIKAILVNENCLINDLTTKTLFHFRQQLFFVIKIEHVDLCGMKENSKTGNANIDWAMCCYRYLFEVLF